MGRTSSVIGGGRAGRGGALRRVGVRETALGEGRRPGLLGGCGSTSAGRHRLRNAEEEKQLEE